MITAPIVTSPAPPVISDELITTSHIQTTKTVVEDTQTATEQLMEEENLFEEPVALTGGTKPVSSDGLIRYQATSQSLQDSNTTLNQITLDLEALNKNNQEITAPLVEQVEPAVEPDVQPVTFEQPVTPKGLTPDEKPVSDGNLAPEENLDSDNTDAKQESINEEQSTLELQAVPAPILRGPDKQTAVENKQADAKVESSSFSDQVDRAANSFDVERSEIMKVMNDVYNLLQCQ
nr:hypothetical protein [Desulfobulbaceae bacterium]